MYIFGFILTEDVIIILMVYCYCWWWWRRRRWWCIHHFQIIIAIIWLTTLNARTRLLLGNLTVTHVLKTSLTFMELTGSVPSSQQSTFWVINKHSRNSCGPQNIHDVTHESQSTYTHLDLHTAYTRPSHLNPAGQIFTIQTISVRLQNSSRWWV